MSNDISPDVEFHHSVLYFVDPVPPNQFVVSERDTHHVVVSWEHRQCYSAYHLTVIGGSDSKTNVTVDAEQAEGGYRQEFFTLGFDQFYDDFINGFYPKKNYQFCGKISPKF